MTTYSVKKTIGAPAHKVWELLTNSASYPEWNTTIVSLDGDIAEGNRIRLVSKVNPKRAFKLTVSEVDEPRHMVWSDSMPLGLFRGVRTFKLAPVGDGSTAFEMTEVFSGLLEPLISKSIPDMSESFDEFGESLKRAAESS